MSELFYRKPAACFQARFLQQRAAGALLGKQFQCWASKKIPSWGAGQCDCPQWLHLKHPQGFNYREVHIFGATLPSWVQIQSISISISAGMRGGASELDVPQRREGKGQLAELWGSAPAPFPAMFSAWNLNALHFVFRQNIVLPSLPAPNAMGERPVLISAVSPAMRGCLSFRGMKDGCHPKRPVRKQCLLSPGLWGKGGGERFAYRKMSARGVFDFTKQNIIRPPLHGFHTIMGFKRTAKCKWLLFLFPLCSHALYQP